MKQIYLIGSLRNREGVQEVANTIRATGNFTVFDDWLSPGPEADDHWKTFEEARGNTYEQALKEPAAQHVFDFDRHHIDKSDIGVLVMPAGKSGHLELGYMIGCGKPGFILMDKPDRWDIMTLFATGIAFNLNQLLHMLDEKEHTSRTYCPHGAKYSAYCNLCTDEMLESLSPSELH